MHTIPAFLNVGSLIIVTIFIFATVGNKSFAGVKLNGSLDEHNNFQTFGSSFLTLIIVMTGEGWYEIMHGLWRQKSVDFECIQEPTYLDFVNNNYQTIGCGYNSAILFFFMYIFCVSMVLLNLFIAVTLQGFNDVQQADNCRITDYSLQQFTEIWSDFDPDGSGFIPVDQFNDFLDALIAKKCGVLSTHQRRDLSESVENKEDLVITLSLKLYSKYSKYHFNDILISLSQLFLYDLASRKSELKRILMEFK